MTDSTMRRRVVGRPAARTLLLTVLGEYLLPRPEGVWQESLVGALEAVGSTEAAARQALARSRHDGWLVAEKHGRRTRLALTPHTAKMLENNGRRIFAFGAPWQWDGRWLLIVLRVPQDRRQVRNHLRTELVQAGMGSLGGGVWVSPHVDREDLVTDILHQARPVVDAVSFRSELGHIGHREDVLLAWNLPALRDKYLAFLESHAGRKPRAPAEVFRDSIELVHDWQRFAFIDPDLPSELLPPHWPRARAYKVFKERYRRYYDRSQSRFDALDSDGR